MNYVAYTVVALLVLQMLSLYLFHLLFKIIRLQQEINKEALEHIDTLYKALSVHLQEHLLGIIREEDEEHV